MAYLPALSKRTRTHSVISSTHSGTFGLLYTLFTIYCFFIVMFVREVGHWLMIIGSTLLPNAPSFHFFFKDYYVLSIVRFSIDLMYDAHSQATAFYDRSERNDKREKLTATEQVGSMTIELSFFASLSFQQRS